MEDFIGSDPSSESRAGRAGAEWPGGNPRADAPRVLCVADALFTLFNLSRVLRERFAVVATDNPVYALSLLERDGDFALVIAANLPELDALEFLDSVRERSPTTVHIVLRAPASSVPASEQLHQAFRVLPQSCSNEELIRAVNDALHYRTLLSASHRHPAASDL